MRTRQLTVLLLALALALFCAYWGARAPSVAEPEAVETAASAPTPTPTPTPEPTPAEPAPEPAPEPLRPDLTARPALIAHAGGSVYGFRLTNSLEALDLAYAAGHRFIEVDLSRTADGELVLIHDWESMAERMLGAEGVYTKSDFLSAKAFAGLTLLDLNGLLDWLRTHADCSIITDLKYADYLTALRVLRVRAGDLTENFIPQLYSWSDYDAVAAMGYPRILLTFYKLKLDLPRLADYLETHALWAVTVAQDRLTEELLDTVRASGTDAAVYAHTVNDYYFYETWQPKGLTGIYTDYFTPEGWPEVRD